MGNEMSVQPINPAEAYQVLNNLCNQIPHHPKEYVTMTTLRERFPEIVEKIKKRLEVNKTQWMKNDLKINDKDVLLSPDSFASWLNDKFKTPEMFLSGPFKFAVRDIDDDEAALNYVWTPPYTIEIFHEPNREITIKTKQFPVSSVE